MADPRARPQVTHADASTVLWQRIKAWLETVRTDAHKDLAQSGIAERAADELRGRIKLAEEILGTTAEPLVVPPTHEYGLGDREGGDA